MKKLVLVIIMLLLNGGAYSQITGRKVASQQSFSENTAMRDKYDSVQSFNPDNAKHHKGQTLYAFIDAFKQKRGYGLRGKTRGYFFTNPHFNSSYYDNYKLAEDVKKIYKVKKHPNLGYGEEYYATDGAEISGKYFYVSDIITKDGAAFLFLQLIRQDNGDTLYYSTEYGEEGIFLTLGYYERLKRRHLNQEYYSTSFSEYKRADSNQTIEIPVLTKFKCLSIDVIEKDVWAVLSNDKVGLVREEFNTFGYYINGFVPDFKYSSIISRFGKEKGEKVLIKDIEVGMTKEMVEEAYGKPTKKITTEYQKAKSELWEYGDKMALYFVSDKLESIQFVH